jgi:hypothetical protein
VPIIRFMDTFVIRVWMPAEDYGSGDGQAMRGIVEHVADGSLMVFDAPEQLLAFINQTVTN